MLVQLLRKKNAENLKRNFRISANIRNNNNIIPPIYSHSLLLNTLPYLPSLKLGKAIGRRCDQFVTHVLYIDENIVPGTMCFLIYLGTSSLRNSSLRIFSHKVFYLFACIKRMLYLCRKNSKIWRILLSLVY